MKTVCFGLLVVMFCEGNDTPKPTSVICPPVVEWKAPDQQAAAAALKELPPGHPLRKMASVTVQQRNINRACTGAKEKQSQ